MMLKVSEKLLQEYGLHTAVFLGFLYSRGKFEGNIQDLANKLRFTRYMLRKVRSNLKEAGYIYEKRFGFPQKIRIELTEKGKRLIEGS